MISNYAVNWCVLHHSSKAFISYVWTFKAFFSVFFPQMVSGIVTLKNKLWYYNEVNVALYNMFVLLASRLHCAANDILGTIIPSYYLDQIWLKTDEVKQVVVKVIQGQLDLFFSSNLCLVVFDLHNCTGMTVVRIQIYYEQSKWGRKYLDCANSCLITSIIHVLYCNFDYNFNKISFLSRDMMDLQGSFWILHGDIQVAI
jgi:hypothetical protein